MTPYRERREQGHYNPDGEPPDPTHSHHLTGLMTAPPPETSASAATVTITVDTTSVGTEWVPAEEPVEEPVEAVEEPEADDEPATSDLDSLTKAELLTRAREQGISPANAAMSKGELRAALEANR